MNDVELIAQALLKSKSAKYLFADSKTYGQTVSLTESTKDYNILLITFSNNGLRQTIVSGNGTENLTVTSVYTPQAPTSRTLEYTRGNLKRVSDKAYIIDDVKVIKDKSIVLNKDATGFKIISIVGIK